MDYLFSEKMVENFTLPEPEKITHCFISDDAISIDTEKGRNFTVKHKQECCENVWLEDNGDIDIDVITQENLMGFSVVSETGEFKKYNEYTCDYDEKYGTWTFIKIYTDKDVYVVRFCGTSNGYYSETAAVYGSGKKEELKSISEFFEYSGYLFED